MAKSRDNDIWISKQSIQKYQSLVSRQADKGGAYVDKAIDAYMRNYPDASVAQVRKFTYEMMQDALPNFTDLSEALSCEFMEEVAARHGWDDVHPEIVRSTDYRLVDKRLHYLAGYLADGDVEKYRAGVLDATRFYIMRAAQDSMIKNCDKAKLRYARVPSGFETCAFCFMLSSRGFVYKTERTAGENHDFHPNCNCTIVPGAKGRTRISGYDPQGMHDRWNACERTVGGDIQAKADWDALSQAERNAYIERHEDETHAFAQFKENRIMREVETRDWHWLYTGEAPKITFETKELESEILSKRPHEIRTANRAGNHGIEGAFQVDERSYYDSEKGVWQTVGLADLRNGYELKTLLDAKWSSVDDYLRKTAKKDGVKTLIIDNFENKGSLVDTVLVMKLRQQRRWDGPIYVITHEDEIIRVPKKSASGVPLRDQPGRNISITHSASSMEEHRSPKPTTEVRSLGGVPKETTVADNLSRASNLTPDDILKRDRVVYKSIGARTASNFTIHIPGLEDSRPIDGSEIEAERIFAGAGSKPYKELRVADYLEGKYGGKAGEWSHISGDIWMFDPIDGKIRKAEVHWFEHPDSGMQEFWWKRWRET